MAESKVKTYVVSPKVGQFEYLRQCQVIKLDWDNNIKMLRHPVAVDDMEWLKGKTANETAENRKAFEDFINKQTRLEFREV